MRGVALKLFCLYALDRAGVAPECAAIHPLVVSFYLVLVCRLRSQRFFVNVACLAVLYSSEFFPLFSLAVISVNTVTVGALDVAPFQRNAVLVEEVDFITALPGVVIAVPFE